MQQVWYAKYRWGCIPPPPRDGGGIHPLQVAWRLKNSFLHYFLHASSSSHLLLSLMLFSLFLLQLPPLLPLLQLLPLLLSSSLSLSFLLHFLVFLFLRFLLFFLLPYSSSSYSSSSSSSFSASSSSSFPFPLPLLPPSLLPIPPFLSFPQWLLVMS